MATYYVDTVDGDDANAGTSEGSGNAWATIDKAMNTVAADDTVYVKASGTYSETATIDTAGTAYANIHFIGYTSTTGDGGQVTIDGGSSRANGLADSLGTTEVFYRFDNFIFQNHTSHGVSLSVRSVLFTNCDASSNSGGGFICGYGAAWYNCTANSNTSHGFQANSAWLIGCTAGNNAALGLYISVWTCGVIGCLFYSNATGNVQVARDGIVPGCVVNCTMDGDNDDSNWGIWVNSDGPLGLVNNIVYDNLNGFYDNNASSAPMIFLDYNLVNANGTQYANVTSGDNDITTAPGFTDESGSDYSLPPNSNAAGAGSGSGEWNIGYNQSKPRILRVI